MRAAKLPFSQSKSILTKGKNFDGFDWSFGFLSLCFFIFFGFGFLGMVVWGFVFGGLGWSLVCFLVFGV